MPCFIMALSKNLISCILCAYFQDAVSKNLKSTWGKKILKEDRLTNVADILAVSVFTAYFTNAVIDEKQFLDSVFF